MFFAIMGVSEMRLDFGTFAIIFGGILATSIASPAAANTLRSNDLSTLAAILSKIAIVVVILESALSGFFNWRVYREVINQRAMKTPVMLGFGLAIGLVLDYDPLSQMLVAAGAQAAAAQGNWLTLLLSAMLLASGSSGINTLFRNLGLRETLPDMPNRPELDEAEAWVSLRVTGAAPGQRYQIALQEVEGEPGKLIAGTGANRRFWERVRTAFRNDAQRFPNFGGWTLTPRKLYRIEVIDTAGPTAVAKYVYEGSFSPRAFVDLDVTV